jgi:hypothetical protein
MHDGHSEAILHVGHRVAACVEEIRRVIWAWGSLMLQAAKWRGVVLGHKRASVSQG